MDFEFTGDVGKPFSVLDTPTRISVGGKEYAVDRERCIRNVPAQFERDLHAHGFSPRERPSVKVHPAAAPVSATPAADARKAE